jgi:hypothetical protein
VNGSKLWPNDPVKKDKGTKRLTGRRDFKQQDSNDILLYAAKSLLNNFKLTSYSKKGYGYDNSCLLNNVLILCIFVGNDQIASSGQFHHSPWLPLFPLLLQIISLYPKA